MADGVERAGDLASCLDANTGSTTVFANGRGITRVMTDSAGAPILGPGSQTIFVEGSKVSLPGDLIVTHGPLGSHAAATTGNESKDVLCGEGSGDQPTIDINFASLDDGGPYIGNVYGNAGNKYFKVMGCYWYRGDITFTYTINNTGDAPTGAFNIGLWEVPYTSNGITYALIRGSDGIMDGTYPIFRGEVRQAAIPAGGQVTGQLVLPSAPKWGTKYVPAHDLWYGWGTASTRSFSLYADLDLEIVETDELNSLPTIGLNAIAKKNCGEKSA